ELAAEHRAVLFCIDEWVMTHFGPDMPRPFRADWALPRVARCEQQIVRIVRQLVGLGVDVVLDLGFMRRKHRDQYRALRARAGAAVRLHALDADVATRRERVRARNAARAGTYVLEVTESMFDWAEGWYEPPSADEL